MKRIVLAVITVLALAAATAHAQQTQCRTSCQDNPRVDGPAKSGGQTCTTTCY